MAQPISSISQYLELNIPRQQTTRVLCLAPNDLVDDKINNGKPNVVAYRTY